MLEGGEEQILRDGELDWSKDNEIPNPEELMKIVKTKSSYMNYIVIAVVTQITSLRLSLACCS